MLKIKILIADDDKIFTRKLRSVCLNKTNIDLRIATTAKACLSVLKKKNYDVLFLGFNLPDSDGPSILSKIFKINPEQIIIIVTDDKDEDAVLNYLKPGVYDYIVKRKGVEKKLLQSAGKAVQYRKIKTEKEIYKAELEKLNNKLNKIIAEKTHKLEEELKQHSESELKFKTLTETSSSAIFIYQNEKFIYVNKFAVKLTGYSKKELLGMKFWDVVHPDHKMLIKQRGMARQRGKKIPQRYEFKIICKNGKEKWIDFTAGLISFEGKPAAIGTAFDITLQKKFEATITDQLNEINLYYDTAPFGLAVLDTNLRYLKINNRLAKINGLSTAEHIGKSVKQIVPSLYKMAKQTTDKIRATGQPVTNIEFVGETNAQTGIRRTWLENWYPLKDDKNSIIGFSVMVQEITERKQAEESLKESEERYRKLIETEPDCIKVLTEDNILHDINPAGLALLEADSPAQVIGKSVLGIINLEYKEAFQELGKKVFRGESGFLEFEITGLKGTRKWLETHATPMRNRNGKIISLLSITRDITERKKMEEALQKAADDWQITFNALNDVVWLLDSKQRILRSNDTAITMFGLPGSEFIGRNCWEILHGTPEPIPGCPIVRMKQSRRRETMLFQWNDRWLEITVDPWLNDAGELTGAVHIMRDITQRKKSEESLIESKKKFRSVIEEAVEIVFTVDTQGYFTYVNPAGLKASGYSIDELRKLKYIDLIEADYQKKVKRNYFQQYLKRSEITTTEYPFLTKTGEIKWFNQNARLIIENDKVTGFYIIARDVTERHKAEEALRASEEKYRLLVDNMGEGVILTDNNDIIKYINKRGGDIYGYTPEELIGKAGYEILEHTDYKNTVLEKTKNRILGASDTYEVKAIKKTGEIIWVRVNGAPIFDADGSVTGSVGIITDITDRKQYEENLEKHVNELIILHNASNAFTISSSLRETGEQIIDTIEQVMDWRRGSIWLKDDSKNKITLLAHSRMGLNSNSFHSAIDRVNTLITNYGDGVSGWVILHGKSIRLGNVKNDPRYIMADPNIQSELCVPMNFRGEIIGCINVESETPDAFTEHDEILLTTIANQAAVAIKNAALYENLKRELKERERAENEATIAKEKAEAANRLKSEFLAQMSHEIRTPLNAVLSYNSLLRDEIWHDKTGEFKEIFDGINNSGSRIIRTIDLILNASELQIGSYDYKPLNIDIHGGVIAAIVSDLKYTAASKGLDLRIDKLTEDTL